MELGLPVDEPQPQQQRSTRRTNSNMLISKYQKMEVQSEVDAGVRLRVRRTVPALRIVPPPSLEVAAALLAL
jgi:hypothetical protein